jgi:hypothetical protein
MREVRRCSRRHLTLVVVVGLGPGGGVGSARRRVHWVAVVKGFSRSARRALAVAWFLGSVDGTLCGTDVEGFPLLVALIVRVLRRRLLAR